MAQLLLTNLIVSATIGLNSRQPLTLPLVSLDVLPSAVLEAAAAVVVVTSMAALTRRWVLAPISGQATGMTPPAAASAVARPCSRLFGGVASCTACVNI